MVVRPKARGWLTVGSNFYAFSADNLKAFVGKMWDISSSIVVSCDISRLEAGRDIIGGGEENGPCRRMCHYRIFLHFWALKSCAAALQSPTHQYWMRFGFLQWRSCQAELEQAPTAKRPGTISLVNHRCSTINSVSRVLCFTDRGAALFNYKSKLSRVLSSVQDTAISTWTIVRCVKTPGMCVMILK